MLRKIDRWMKSKQGKTALYGLIALVVIIGIIGLPLGWWAKLADALFGTAVASYPDPKYGYTCFPSCEANDGKFLAISNQGTYTFTGEKIVLWVAIPGNKTTFDLAIFDGDSGRDAAGNVNWLNGNWDDTNFQSTYTLYADPLKNGQGTSIVGTWYGNDSNMPNNDWYSVTLNNVAAAQSPSGHYFYRLEVTQPDVSPSGANAFKVRSSGYLSTGTSDLVNASVGLVGGLATTNDLPIIYPQFQSFKSLGPSPYTGQWQLYFYVPNDLTKLEIWDGDFDRGTSAIVALDKDDPNTDGKPAWASSYARNEGQGGRGIPADDSSNATYRRSPAVEYWVVDPAGNPIYPNATQGSREPSGTEEWEDFILSTDATVNSDIQVTEIKEGYYNLVINGLDLHNLVWLRLSYELIPSTCDGPCTPPPVWPEGSCPRTIGYWKNNVDKLLIQGRTNGTQETVDSLHHAMDIVALASPLYRSGINVSNPVAISTPTRLTDAEIEMILQRADGYPGDRRSMLARALQQNMATWMNLASGKIGPTTVVDLKLANGTVVYQGTVWGALQTAQAIILNPAHTEAELERAKNIADLINNGLLGENASTSVCTDYVQQIPPDKQPPSHENMPKAPKGTEPAPSDPGLPPAPSTCTEVSNTYQVEATTNNPFAGIKFNYASGTEVRDGSYDIFKITVSNDVAASLGAAGVQLEAKAANEQGTTTLTGCDFTSAEACGTIAQSDNGYFWFTFLGAVDNGNGTKTLTFQVQNDLNRGLSHVTFGIPADPGNGSYQSVTCP